MRITISGTPGSGTTTISRSIAERFGLAHINAGGRFRQWAERRGITIDELNRQAEADERLDREFHEYVTDLADDHERLLFESRYSSRDLNDIDVRVWFDAPIEVRSRRIADRNDCSVAQAKQTIQERERSVRKRSREYYGIDIDDRSIYDLCINTGLWNVEDSIEILAKSLASFSPEIEGESKMLAD